MTEEAQPIAYTCVMGGPAALTAQMEALGAARGWGFGNFGLQASTNGSPPASWVLGTNVGVPVTFRAMVVDRVFDAPGGFTEAQVNGLIDAMAFTFRPVYAGDKWRTVFAGQLAEYLAANGLTLIEAGEV